MNQHSQLIYDEVINKINNNTLQLASLPDVIVKVNTVLSDETKGIADIAKVIQAEVAISTRIIRIANSPGLRGTQEITSIADAISRLGTTLVKNLAIIVSLNDMFKTKNVIHKNLMEMLFDDSIESSVCGYMMTKYLVPSLNPEMSLINGLVSKIGHIVVLRYMNDTEPYKTYNQKETCSVVTDIGAKVGAALLIKWSFPQSCIDSVFSSGSITNQLNTYSCVVATTQKYIEYKSNPAVEHLEIFYLIDAIIERHHTEYKELLSLMS